MIQLTDSLLFLLWTWEAALYINWKVY